jgi:hypothetical protein
MYNVINVLIHLICFGVIAWSSSKNVGYRGREITLDKFLGVVAIWVLCIWAALVGEIYNLKSIFALL